MRGQTRMGCNNKIFPKNINRGVATSPSFILVNPENITNLENFVTLNDYTSI